MPRAVMSAAKRCLRPVLGSFSPLLANGSACAEHLSAKGYSVTMPVKDAPWRTRSRFTDDEYKLVFSRLGDQLRIAAPPS